VKVSVSIYRSDASVHLTTLTTVSLATLGLEPVGFDSQELLASEEAAKRGEHHPLKDALARLRARRRE